MSHAQKGSGCALKVYFHKRYSIPFCMRRMPRNRDVAAQAAESRLAWLRLPALDIQLHKQRNRDWRGSYFTAFSANSVVTSSS